MADLLGDPGWRRLLAAARRSLERTGGSLDGAVSLSAPTDAERLVVIGVTGVHRPAGVGRLTVRLAELDEHLRAAYGDGLAARARAAARPAGRTHAGGGRARRRCCRSPPKAGTPAPAWYEEWLDGLRRDGTLTRIVRGGLPFADVVRSSTRCPRPTSPCRPSPNGCSATPRRLPTGSSAVSCCAPSPAWHGVGSATGAEQERALWELAGVVPDDLASQVLVLGVPASGGMRGRVADVRGGEPACRSG